MVIAFDVHIEFRKVPYPKSRVIDFRDNQIHYEVSGYRNYRRIMWWRIDARFMW